MPFRFARITMCFVGLILPSVPAAAATIAPCNATFTTCVIPENTSLQLPFVAIAGDAFVTEPGGFTVSDLLRIFNNVVNTGAGTGLGNMEGNLYGRSLSASAPPHRFWPGGKGGLYAWEQVRQYPEVVLVEGLFDYAVLSQAGFHNVTCSMRNHLNVHQYRQLCDLREPLMPTQTVVASRRRSRLPRKIQKLNLLELTGGCRMNGWFAKVGLN